MDESTALVYWTQAKYAIEQAHSLDEVKGIRDKAAALQAYSRQIGESAEVQNKVAEIKIRAERRAGELLKETPKAKGGEQYRSTGCSVQPVVPPLRDIGIEKTQAHRWQRIAKIPEPVFEQHIADTVSKGEELTTAGVLKLTEAKAHVSYNSGDNEWYTPEMYSARAAMVMGGIDLDPASSETANVIVGASKIYTVYDDGLSHEWSGRVFMNPPYESSLITKFTQKLVESYVSGKISQAIVLVNNATETKWFQNLASNAYAICFVNGRIKFWHDCKNTWAPLQGQAILYFGNSKELFIKEFDELGFICFVSQKT